MKFIDVFRYEMNVPNDIIGAVIGKRGAKINEIRNPIEVRAGHNTQLRPPSETAIFLRLLSFDFSSPGLLGLQVGPGHERAAGLELQPLPRRPARVVISYAGAVDEIYRASEVKRYRKGHR